MAKIKILMHFGFVVMLSACGGGGDSSSSSSSSTPASTISLATPAGTMCANDFGNTDAFGNITFSVSQPINASSWGCLVVDKANNQPVYSGSQSVRFEVRPGDCNASSTFNDCVNDRSRWEIFQNRGKSTQGEIITYEYAIYVPSQPLIQPPPTSGPGSKPLTVLTQINWQCSSSNPCSSLGSGGYGALAFLKIDYTGALYLQTHLDFTWVPNQTVLVDSNSYNKWIKMRYVIKSTAASDGYIQIYANDKLLINETRATLPNSNASDTLKLGIYNSSLSSASQAWQTQVVYFDGFGIGITNF
ncbi:heparin lyase I family protein [Polynucleobacter sp. 15G-AUS-farblos]|uniref:heparin lyase I family protein n=1 Tax=Polynucleobacter sp. 15G-AUS-farblos TaxID=2689094 RepID=UPI001C0CEC2D|nr:heparin lyase I family protein [Polynucleobacter sp. 15G-AUS-farblos]MBU3583223.1 heparin lyase I family protein [Polynucleobacter sp. 15G-AUS-farblos]